MTTPEAGSGRGSRELSMTSQDSSVGTAPGSPRGPSGHDGNAGLWPQSTNVSTPRARPDDTALVPMWRGHRLRHLLALPAPQSVTRCWDTPCSGAEGWLLWPGDTPWRIGRPSTERGWRGGSGAEQPPGDEGAGRATQLPPRHPPPHPDMNHYLMPGIGDPAGNELKDQAPPFLPRLLPNTPDAKCRQRGRDGRASGSCSPRPQARGTAIKGSPRSDSTLGPGASTHSLLRDLPSNRPHGHLPKASSLQAFFQKPPSLATKCGPLSRLL